jgi:hypothetical protein
MTAQQEASRGGILERAQIDRLDDRQCGRPGPRDGLGVRVDLQHAQLEPVREVVWRRVRRGSAPHSTKSRLDGGEPGHDVRDGLAPCQPEARMPSPRSTTADITRDPARPTACAISGQASSLRSMRTRARRRRHPHHQGTARMMPPAARSWGERSTQRADTGRDAEPEAVCESYYCRVGALAQGKQPEPGRRPAARGRPGWRRPGHTSASPGASCAGRGRRRCQRRRRTAA